MIIGGSLMMKGWGDHGQTNRLLGMNTVIYSNSSPILIQLSPAESRELNKECALLGFYDNHDIWHFLTAFGLFFSFLVSSYHNNYNNYC